MHSLLLLSDRAVGEALTSALQRRRGVVRQVSSLDEALVRLRNERFDVLFLDWAPSHHSLGAVAATVRVAHPDNPRLIVAVGRPPDDAALTKARAVGLSDILELTDSLAYLDLRLATIEGLADPAEHQAEAAALARSEHRYRRIVEDGLTPIFEHDFDGRLLWANAVFLRMSGYSLAELQQKTLADLLAPSAHFGISWYMQDLVRDGWTEGSVRTQGSDGTPGYWLFRSLVTSDDGQHQVTGYGYDVTAARLAEEALRRSEERARGLAEEANERVKELQVLAEVGQVVEGELDHAALYQSVVQQLYDAFGYASVGVYTADAEGHSFTREYLARHGHTSLPEWLPDNEPHVQQLLDGDGAAVRWAEAMLAPGVAANSAAIGLVPIYDGVRTVALVAIEPRPEADLTDDDLRRLRLIADLVDNVVSRARLFTEARESEARFRSAFDDAAIGMALLALDGTWLEANAAAEALLGVSQADLRTTTALALTHPQDALAARSGM
jgi:PAS domain S-box-containing protein